MMDIDDRIKYEYENMLQAIMPSERIQHAKKLAELEKEKSLSLNVSLTKGTKSDGG